MKNILTDILADINFLHQLNTDSLLNIKIKLEKEVQNLQNTERRRIDSPSFSKATEDFEFAKSQEIYFINKLIDTYKKRIKKDEIIQGLNEEKYIWLDSFEIALISEIDSIKKLLTVFNSVLSVYDELENRLIGTKKKIAILEAAYPHETDPEVKVLYASKRDKLSKEFFNEDEEFQKFKSWISLKIQLKHFEQIENQIKNNLFDLEQYCNSIYGYRTNWDLLYSKGLIDTGRKLFLLLSSIMESKSFQFYQLQEWYTRYYVSKS